MKQHNKVHGKLISKKNFHSVIWLARRWAFMVGQNCSGLSDPIDRDLNRLHTWMGHHHYVMTAAIITIFQGVIESTAWPNLQFPLWPPSWAPESFECNVRKCLVDFLRASLYVHCTYYHATFMRINHNHPPTHLHHCRSRLKCVCLLYHIYWTVFIWAPKMSRPSWPEVCTVCVGARRS